MESKLMEISLNYQEAINRMSRRGTKSISWTGKITVEYKYIRATQARNWDGSFAGEGQDNSRIILQRIVWVDGNLPRFTNWW